MALKEIHEIVTKEMKKFVQILPLKTIRGLDLVKVPVEYNGQQNGV